MIMYICFFFFFEGRRGKIAVDLNNKQMVEGCQKPLCVCERTEGSMEERRERESKSGGKGRERMLVRKERVFFFFSADPLSLKNC